MNKALDFLKGKKTYLTALALAASTFVYAMSWIDENTYMVLVGLFGASGMAALRNSVK